MIRKIIRIDKEKCNGCGACATACHEGAIDMIDGKPNWCESISATVWGIVSRNVLPAPFPLKSGKHRNTTKKP